jgi:hypothetical protein
MTKRYAGRNYPVYEIWSWYKRQVTAATDAAIPARWWAYQTFTDGTPIEKAQRVIYRQRSDLQESFPNPFQSGEGSFQQWLAGEGL